MEQEIFTLAKAYLQYAQDVNEVPADEFLLVLIARVIGDYKERRCYPDTMTEAEINADVEKYFSMKKGYVATDVIPAMIGKVGSEGLYSLVDNQVSKNWKYPFAIYFPDVVPYCGVV